MSDKVDLSRPVRRPTSYGGLPSPLVAGESAVGAEHMYYGSREATQNKLSRLRRPAGPGAPQYAGAGPVTFADKAQLPGLAASLIGRTCTVTCATAELHKALRNSMQAGVQAKLFPADAFQRVTVRVADGQSADAAVAELLPTAADDPLPPIVPIGMGSLEDEENAVLGPPAFVPIGGDGKDPFDV